MSCRCELQISVAGLSCTVAGVRCEVQVLVAGISCGFDLHCCRCELQVSVATVADVSCRYSNTAG